MWVMCDVSVPNVFHRLPVVTMITLLMVVLTV
jgi:hypothetical protein